MYLQYEAHLIVLLVFRIIMHSKTSVYQQYQNSPNLIAQSLF